MENFYNFLLVILNGSGCPSCNKPSYTTDQIIFKFKKIHGDTYEYLDSYVSMKTKFKIKCPTHGIFFQSPDNHLKGKRMY